MSFCQEEVRTQQHYAMSNTAVSQRQLCVLIVLLFVLLISCSLVLCSGQDVDIAQIVPEQQEGERTADVPLVVAEQSPSQPVQTTETEPPVGEQAPSQPTPASVRAGFNPLSPFPGGRPPLERQRGRRDIGRRGEDAPMMIIDNSTVPSGMIVVQHGDHPHLRPDPNRVVPHGSHTHTVGENERNSGYIFMVMLTIIVASQSLLVWWKRNYPQSYDQCSLVGLWIIPFLWSIYGGFIRMLLVWTVYTVVCGVVMSRAMKRPIERTTPRIVYQWFALCYRCCAGVTMLGYVVLMLDLMGVFLLFGLGQLGHIGFMLMFYGIYYGVLSRDLCAVSAMSMAVSIGYVGQKGDIPTKSLPQNRCALCDSTLYASVRLTDSMNSPDQAAGGGDEKVVTLPCHHQFHEFCMRGWVIIGKRDTCPSCYEKVSTSTLFGPAIWEKGGAAWTFVLDAMRYLIVFNPIILLLSQGVLYLVY